MSRKFSILLKRIAIMFLVITLTQYNIILIGNSIVEGLISYALNNEESSLEDKVFIKQELITNRVCNMEEEKRVVQIALTSGIDEKEYPIKTSEIILKKDIINNLELEDIVITSLNKNSYTVGSWQILENSIKITLVNENEILEEKPHGLDKLLVTYILKNTEENTEEELEIQDIKMPIESVYLQTYLQETVTKQIKENTFENLETEEMEILNIENTDIHKTTILENSVKFNEKLNLDLSYRKDTKNITIEDISNSFYNEEEVESKEASLKYSSTKINKEDLINLLDEDGKLTITDKNEDKVLAEITKEKVESLELDNKYEQKFLVDEETKEDRSYLTITKDYIEIEYITDVKNINFSLENIKPQSKTNIESSNFVIENAKFISAGNNLDNLNYLEEKVKYIIDEEEKEIQSTIKFKDTITRATVNIDNNELVLGKTNKVNFTITLDTQTEKSELFVNPIFVLELPESVSTVNIVDNYIIIDYDNGVFANNLYVTSVLNKKYVVLKLNGEQTAETTENENITINLPLELEIEENEEESDALAKMYYKNNTVTAYESGRGFDVKEIPISLILQNEEIKGAIEEEASKIDEEDETEEIYEEDEVEEIDETVTGSISSFTYSLSDELIKQGEQIEYIVDVANRGETQENDVQLIDILSEDVTLKSVTELIEVDGTIDYDSGKTIDYKYDQTKNQISIELGNLPAATTTEYFDEEINENVIVSNAKSRNFKIVVETKKLEEGTYSKEIKNVVQVKKQDALLSESECSNIVSDAFIVIETEDLPESIREKEDINFKIKITNKGLIKAKDVKVNISVPESITVRMVEETLLSIDGKEKMRKEATVFNNEFKLNIDEIPEESIYCVNLLGTVEHLGNTDNIIVNGTVDNNKVSWQTKIDEEIDEEQKQDKIKDESKENENEKSQTDEDAKTKNPDEELEEFDLSLKQMLNKITVSNSKETTTYNYTDTNFAKIEIPVKEMADSLVTLEYKIIIKNEGTIPGYARKIADYIPENVTFNSELNPNWYAGEDGNLYSVAFIDKLLKPGDAVELNLILTKKMTNDNEGIIKNVAEIYEATNNLNIEDINSVPGDKLENQNDMSKVEVIIAVKTGVAILYILLLIISIGIIVIGIDSINKKVIKEKQGGC